MVRIRNLLIGGVVGAAAAYLFDPDQGPGRRTRIQQELTDALQRLLGGAQAAVAGLEPSSSRADDDLSVLSRVESVLLDVPSLARGSVETEVVDGTVVLRGQVASAEQERDVVAAAGRVPGVAGVESLLTVPGEGAPAR